MRVVNAMMMVKRENPMAIWASGQWRPMPVRLPQTGCFHSLSINPSGSILLHATDISFIVARITP